MSFQILFSYIYRIIYFIVMPIQIALYTNSLSVEQYGLLNLIVNTAIMSTVLFSFGLHNYSAITIPKHFYIKQLYIFKNILIFELLSFLLLSLCAIYIIQYFHLINLDIETFYLILFTYFNFLLMNEFGKFFSYQHKLEVRLFLGILELILIVSTLYLVNEYYSTLTIKIILFIYLSVYILINLIYIFIIKNIKIFFTRLNYKLIKRALIFSIPLIFSDLSFRLMQNIDSYLLLYYNLKYELGLYSFTIKIINVLYLISSPILWVFYPYLVKYSNKPKFNYYLETQLRYTGLITVVSLSLFLINIETLIPIIATKEYIANKLYFYIVSLYPLLLLYIYNTYQILMIDKRKNIILISYLSGLTINTLFSFYLIDIYGIYGAFYSTILGLSSIFIIMMFFVKPEYKSMILKYFIIFITYLMFNILFLLNINSVLLLNIFFPIGFSFLIYHLKIHTEIYIFIRKKIR